MRQIKFRGKFEYYGEREGLASWLYGSLLLEKSGCVYILPEDHTCVSFGDIIIEDESHGGPDTGCYMPSVLPETVGQFTGLYDKDGKEIYEGDILANGSGDLRHIVSYDSTEGAFIGTVPGMYDTLGNPLNTNLRQWWLNKYGKRVIGNIHDNPEMIEK